MKRRIFISGALGFALFPLRVSAASCGGGAGISEKTLLRQALSSQDVSRSLVAALTAYSKNKRSVKNFKPNPIATRSSNGLLSESSGGGVLGQFGGRHNASRSNQTVDFFSNTASSIQDGGLNI